MKKKDKKIYRKISKVILDFIKFLLNSLLFCLIFHFNTQLRNFKMNVIDIRERIEEISRKSLLKKKNFFFYFSRRFFLMIKDEMKNYFIEFFFRPPKKKFFKLALSLLSVQYSK